MLVTKSLLNIPKRSARLFSSWWADVDRNPPDSILGLLENFKNDKDPRKVNLTAGAYRCENGKPWILPSVKMAIDQFNNSDYNLEYIPINGYRPFINGALDLAYGAGHHLIKENRLASMQVMSGCGALYVGYNFWREHQSLSRELYVSGPTWPIQSTMSEYLGFETKVYPYYNQDIMGIDFNAMMNSLDGAKEGALVVLHACAHNPTGFDLNMDQWRQVMELTTRKRLIPFFDMAYQGFASGNLSTDNAAVRLFADNNVQMMVGTSFAKNMGLYGTRTGSLSIVCDNEKEAGNVQSHMDKVGRNTWSSGPMHGVQIANIVLSTPEIRTVWDQDLLTMSGRIREMRELFVKSMYAGGSKDNWDFILDQIGMFAFTGLGKKQCQYLMDKHHVYLTLNGRISICGLTKHNMKYTVDAILDATKDGRS